MSVGTSTAKRTATPPATSAVAAQPSAPPAPNVAAPAAAHGSQSAPTSYAKAATNPYSTGNSASKTAPASDKAPGSKPAAKTDKKAVDREWSMKNEKSSKAEKSLGDKSAGKAADKALEEVKGGKKIVGKEVSTEKKEEVKKEFDRTLYKGDAGELKDHGKVGAELKGTAGAHINLNTKGLDIGAEAKVEARAGGEYNISFKSKEFTINGEKVRADFSLNLSAAAVAEAGGKVELAMTVGPPPKAVVKLGGKAFAGVQAGAELTGSLVWVKGKGEEVTLVKGSVGASVSAGIGASAGLEAGYADGKLSLNAYAGVTLGVGASVKVKAEVDVKAVGEFAKKVGEKGVKDLVGGLVSQKDIDAVAMSLAKKWQELPGAIVKKVGGDAVNAGKDMDKVAKEAADEVAKQAKAGKPVNVVQITREKMEKSDNVVVKGAGGAVRVFEWLNGW